MSSVVDKIAETDGVGDILANGETAVGESGVAVPAGTCVAEGDGAPADEHETVAAVAPAIRNASKSQKRSGFRRRRTGGNFREDR